MFKNHSQQSSTVTSSLPQRWILNLPLKKKLSTILWLMAVIIVVNLFCLWAGMELMSSLRAYIIDESLWSKAQKESNLHLNLYTASRDERHYQDFLKSLKVQLGDRKARLEME